MKNLEELKFELDYIKLYYSNKELFEHDKKMLELVERYNSVMALAPANLFILYKYRYQYNQCNKELASTFGFSLRYITELNSKLNTYLMERV